MIGNDVVDLDLAKSESNWERKGYIIKIFTEYEQKLIQNSSYKTETIWILWSRKEAVYKIILQQNGSRGYYPLKIKNIDFEKGLVEYNNQIFFTNTKITNSKIHTIALLKPDFDNVIINFDKNKIKKVNSIPYLLLNNKYINVSISHHGKYEELVSLIQ